MAKSILIPKQLQRFRLTLEKSAMEYMRCMPNTKATNLMNSKLGGMPYLPKGATHPRDATGEYMLLLAQINFSEDSFPSPFPTKGLLQFFMSSWSYEQTLKTGNILPPNYFRIRYSPITVVHDMIEDFTYLHGVSMHQFPFEKELSLSFSREIEPVSATDYRLNAYIPPNLVEQFTQTEQQRFSDIYFHYFSSADHKMGGYPYFINEDIRATTASFKKYDTLLLQIVSDDEMGIMWGDSGVLKFFINHEKLEKCDFSDVLLYIEDY
ncbi:YwqG family protein [Lysinibacillus sp. KU-BSD001]|uniref:YwqG family protein n=1 Tax=Lysinibacillus sp. KU-BSD001 TaxID=3141328 RepID=UPI0036E20489